MRELISRTFQILKSSLVLTCAGSAFVILAVTGPFGTFDSLQFPVRAGYWGLVVVTWAIALTFVLALQEKYLPELPLLRSAFVVSGALTLFYTPLLYSMGHLLTGHLRDITPILTVALFVYFVNFLVVQVRYYWEQAKAAPVVEESERLGGVRPCDVRHVTVDDHYVILNTSNGEKRLLMRFADALHELKHVAGMQVHRSHWVAENAVEQIAKKGGQVQIALVDGSSVPVSRGYQEDVYNRFSNQVR